MKYFANISAALAAVLALFFVTLKIIRNAKASQTPAPANSDPRFITR